MRSHQPPGRFSQEIVFPCDASDGPLGLGELLLERGLSGATFGLVGESQFHALDGLFALPGEGLLGDPELMAGLGYRLRFWPYALEWGERVLILGGDGRLGQVTPPA